MNTARGERAGTYPTTIWSEVGRAGRLDDDSGLSALDGLLRKYYGPLQRHLALQFHASDDQAADWLQSFLLRKVLLGSLLAQADRRRGRFRTFLLNAVDRFVLDEFRHQNRQSRMPAGGLGSIEELSPDASQLGLEAEDRFAADWAHKVVELTVSRMREECRQGGHPARWEVFEGRVLDPILEGTPPVPFGDLVERFGFRSPAEASNVLITGKRMFHRLLREVVSEYAGEKSDVEAEIRELRRILAARRNWPMMS